MKEHVKVSTKFPSTTRWESRIKCIVPLRFYLSDVLDALKELLSYCMQKQDAMFVCFLINVISSWKFILVIVICTKFCFKFSKRANLCKLRHFIGCYKKGKTCHTIFLTRLSKEWLQHRCGGRS